MSEESIFESTTPDSEVNPAPSFTLPQEASELIGEGKKYKSVEDALKSVPHAQNHINKLEQEMATLREELAKRKAAEELLEEMKGTVAKENTTPVASFDPNVVSSLVDEALTRKQQEQKAMANIDAVKQAFIAKFGEKAEEEYIKVASESGVDITNLNKLSASSPTAVLRLAGIDGLHTRPAPSKPSSSINTEAMGQGSVQKPSARVQGNTTKDLLTAWEATKQLI